MEKKDGEKKEGEVETETTTTTTTSTEDHKPDPELEKLKKENETLKFNDELRTIATTYPHATEFKDKIQEKVAKGYSVADATIVVLSEQKKLVTAEQIQRGTKESAGFGGSMDTVTTQDKKEPVPGEQGSVEFYGGRLKELESKGEIFIS